MSHDERAVQAILEKRIEAASVELDVAVGLVEQLALMVNGGGGYMAPEHQATMRQARAFLARHGRRIA